MRGRSYQAPLFHRRRRPPLRPHRRPLGSEAYAAPSARMPPSPCEHYPRSKLVQSWRMRDETGSTAGHHVASWARRLESEALLSLSLVEVLRVDQFACQSSRATPRRTSLPQQISASTRHINSKNIPFMRLRSRSIRAARTALAPTVRCIFIRKSGGVCCTRSDWKMKPVCRRCVALEKPAAIFFCAPRSYKHAGKRCIYRAIGGAYVYVTRGHLREPVEAASDAEQLRGCSGTNDGGQVRR
jgi:hypothetical protein